MKINTDQYWITLHEDSFLWVKGHIGLIYNVSNNTGFKFKNINPICEITKELINLDNLYSVLIDENTYDDKSVIEFIELILKHKCGKVTKYTPSEDKPISLPPYLKLQKGVDRLSNSNLIGIGDDILSYIHELNVNFDFTEEISNRLINEVILFIDRIKHSSIRNIYINLSGQQEYAIIEEFVKGFNLIGMSTVNTVCISIENLLNNIGLIYLIKQNNFELKIIIEEVNEEHILHVYQLLNEPSIKYEWEFLVYSVESYEKAEIVADKLGINNFNIKPHFNGTNIKFFEDNIFLTEEELQRPGLSKREIFAHQALNTNYFGKLTISSDGNVYSNINGKPLGTINDDVKQLILHEMENGSYWLKIRDMEPCCNCVYQWLCPSPSDYELQIGKPNLCHVKQ